MDTKLHYKKITLGWRELPLEIRNEFLLKRHEHLFSRGWRNFKYCGGNYIVNYMDHWYLGTLR